MITNLFDRGRRLYATASLLTLFVAAGHMYGMSRPLPPEYDLAVQAMQSTRAELTMGMSPSFWDFDRSLGYGLGIALGVMGLLCLILAGTTEATSRVLSRTAAVMTAGCMALTALCWIYKVPPPLILFGFLSLGWGLAQRTTRLA